MSSGQAATGDDFGLYQTASVSGTVFRDNNANASKDSGDSGLSGRTVTATPSTGSAITTATAADGTYTITGLKPGVGYTISVAHSGETCSTPNSADCTQTATPTSGQTLTGDDFGLYQTASVSGTVFRDNNANASKDSGDSGLSGRTVTATPLTGSAITTTTTADGAYTLTGLKPGVAYSIQVDRTTEACSIPNITNCTYTETLSSGQDLTGDDFGLYGGASVSGTVFRDSDANGAKDSGDSGLSGRTVTATPLTGSTITTTTAADGTYTLNGLTPGVQYTISVSHSGESCSTPNSADCTQTATPTSGQTLTGDDFGLYQTASVSGTVFRDNNANASKDSGDSGLSGRTVTATP
ncbi:MAG: hypothetical protein E6G56_11725, partial [Actinobacteria bacterium]